MKNSRMWRWLGYLAIATIMSFSVQTEASAQSFKDVTAKNPYRDIIQDMEKKGLISGYSDGTFRPNAKITRKDVAQSLSKALKLETKKGTVISYKDVPKNHPYYDAISKVSQAGIFSGDVNGKFNPDAALTRIQMAKVLDLAFQLNIKSFSDIEDVNHNHWGFMHVHALYSNGITTGDQGKFNPSQPLTRAHYAVFLSRTLNKPGLPKASTTLSKEGIVNLIYRLPNALETVLYDHKERGKQFSTARTELLKNATPSLTDNLLKEYYAQMCTDCDGSLFTYISDEMDYRFEILENTATKVRIRTVEFDIPGPNAAGGYIEYGFEKQAGKWKLSLYKWDPIGARSFNLTKEEAIRIVKNSYEYYGSTSVRVTFQSSGYENVSDWYTDRDYRRVVYRMHVSTRQGNHDVLFYPHNGRHDEQ